ncbi:MAG: DNA topoisomerase IV subunit A [Myxococcales bacterium]|nr:DNA topoisomerase IV subunit A [Myxococcales bacterium]
MIPPPIPDVSLSREAERRYLNYALSVIRSRALPDVRDGLKPVQRRILYAMFEDLGLRPEARHRKSAAVVGEVMGKYHPHGDVAIYEAMVRMAQSFSMRACLVDGQGNFGSPDGDGAAAMRYTEARLTPLAMLLMEELDRDTVALTANYDGTRQEPTVLPSRFPNLLVNGSYGIAVGMATSIPPHNLGEIIDACLSLIDDGEPNSKRLLKLVRGPDFPTGGELVTTKQELQDIYETGHGSLKLRGEWTHEPTDKRGQCDYVIITSTPYGIERGTVVEKIAEVVLQKKLPLLLDVRDESTEAVRVVLELKHGADPQLVMAYLYKHTPLLTNVQINLTCLVPSEDGGLQPARLGLHAALTHFLDFRFETVTKRLEFELAKLLDRIHILEGFELVFDRLDEVIRIIRKSDGKADAAVKLIGRFGLSAVQAEAILELKLYRLAKLEILAIERELTDKRAQAASLRVLLLSDTKRWGLVRRELSEVRGKFAQKRVTKIVTDVDEPEFSAEEFIVDEDAVVILCQSGWVKRVRTVKDVHQTRMRDGDSVLAAVRGSTRASVGFFSNQGTAYVCRIDDVPAASGYGDPIQKQFKLGDGERIIAMMSFDARVLEVKPAEEGVLEPQPPFALAVTKGGLGTRLSLRTHAEPSTRAGRKFCKLNEGDEVLAVVALGTRAEADWVMCAADDGHALAVLTDEIPVLGGPGKGVIVMKIGEGASLIGAELGWRELDTIMVETGLGKERSITLRSIEGSRAGRGHALVKRGGFARYLWRQVATPDAEGG